MDRESPRFTKRAAARLQSMEEVEGPKPPASPSEDQDEAFLGTQDGRHKSGVQQTKQQPFLAKRESKPPRRRLSQEQLRPWAQQEVCIEGQEPGVGKRRLSEEARALQRTSASEISPVLGKISAAAKGPGSEKASLSKKRGSPGKSGLQRSVPEKVQLPEQALLALKTAAAERSTPEKSPDVEHASESPGRSLVLEKASMFEKSLVPETTLALSRAASSGELQSPARRPRGRTLQGKSPSSFTEQAAPDPHAVASRIRPSASQVKISSKDPSSPTPPTYGCSGKYSSLRAKSFPMSPREDNQTATLTHSASVKLPPSSGRLGEKLQRYHTAIKRRESVRSPGISTTEIFVAPGLVASKSRFFEKGLVSQSHTGPAFSHKENLELSGIVSSRLKLWTSRIQASGDQSS